VMDHGLFCEMNMAQLQIQASTYPYVAVRVRTERRQSQIGLVLKETIYSPIRVSTDQYLENTDITRAKSR